MSANLTHQIEAAINALASISRCDGSQKSSKIQPESIGLRPLESCALVSFLRHERRQEWVRYVVESRLQGSAADLAESGAFGHPEEVPQSGDVPGEEGWRYFFHGRGCCFSHQDGTVLDVDFADDGTALDIDAYFYTRFLSSSPSLVFCESQLRQPDGLENAWQVALPSLTLSGMIQKEWRFRLSDDGRRVASSLEPLLDFIETSTGFQRCEALKIMGDYVSAERDAARAGINSTELSAAAKRQISENAAALRAVLHQPDDSSARCALASLASLGKDQAFEDVAGALLRKPAGGLNHTALVAIKQWEGQDVIRALIDALRLFAPPSLRQRLQMSFSWSKANDQSERVTHGLVTGIAAALFAKLPPQALSTEVGGEMRRVLHSDCKACDDDAAFFLYLLEPNAGLAKLKKNLSNPVPITRQGAASYLALIATQASEAILVETALGAPTAGGHEAACALSLMESNTAQAAALQWLRRNDEFEEAEGTEIDINGKKVRTWSIDDVLRSNLREHLHYDFESKRTQFGSLLQLWMNQLGRKQ